MSHCRLSATTLVFGLYWLTGAEGSDFQKGDFVTLDGIDGFFDQSLDNCKAGDRLDFIIDDHRLPRSARGGWKLPCQTL